MLFCVVYLDKYLLFYVGRWTRMSALPQRTQLVDIDWGIPAAPES
jgi:hypothetical protein